MQEHRKTCLLGEFHLPFKVPEENTKNSILTQFERRNTDTFVIYLKCQNARKSHVWFLLHYVVKNILTTLTTLYFTEPQVTKKIIDWLIEQCFTSLPTQYRLYGRRLIEHGFTSAPTQYRLYGRRFLADRTNGRAIATLLRLSSSVTLCIVAKRCVLEQKLLWRAYRKSYMRNRLVPKWMTLTFV